MLGPNNYAALLERALKWRVKRKKAGLWWADKGDGMMYRTGHSLPDLMRKLR